MKITENINLAGLIFTIDEDALLKLQNYLNSIERYFGTKEEREEILSDIEARIAELFQAQLGKSKEVISMLEVNKIIEVLGTPEEFLGYGDKSEYQSSNYAYKRSNRLFRDTENKYVGGVCSGLAYYYNIDPVILRVIFVLCVGLGSVLVYIIFWIVLPPAYSINDKFEMKGYRTKNTANY